MARKRERGFPDAPEPLPVAVADNHTHLESIAHVLPDGVAPPTPEAHLAAALAAGVDRVVQVGCDLESARWTAALLADQDAGCGVGADSATSVLVGGGTMAGGTPTGAGRGLDVVVGSPGALARVVGAVAIHPNEATLHAGVDEVGPDGMTWLPEERHAVSLDDAIAEIAAIAKGSDRVRAIGETGMDLFRTGPRGEAVQRDSFRAHIALAKELDLALQIHDRDAHAQVIEVLLADGAPERTVFHCFSGDEEMARLCADHGWYLSFAGPVTYPANHHLRAALGIIPRELVLVETDAPYLTPHPYRGRPNAPFAVAHTVRAMAGYLEIDLAELCETISATSDRVYGPW
ncbi:TatD family hydrolase [Antribacter sp. KLBMP9083]|uniref:TatD family hydrolase n=1 Tax=Antribacter soli TaxID=2910976 RepID=A0AA41QD56_9MICO|nr:TatD family hydrolase [Antribacter soli]MCF4119937.1 TatD family hydrolase [Antribacter soli]